MKNISLQKFKYLEVVFIVVLASALAFVFIQNTHESVAKDRDALRISDINKIRFALGQYKTDHGMYPPCLYQKDSCQSLEGSTAMPVVPKDPLTGLGYTYSGLGSGASCTSFHVGASLERTGSQALLTGSDAPPQASTTFCTGSAPDFSGLSYSPGGQPCNALVGRAQPTPEENGETCYDLKPRSQ